MNLDWDDIHWSDPEGGTIVLHGVLPTVVLPLSMRPRIKWHGLCLMANADEIEIWKQEEKAESQDSGINLDSAILNGGLDGMFLETITYVEDLQVGRFPDPEPRRLHRNAETHNRPVYFAEPDLDDESWMEHLEDEAKAMTKPRKLLQIVFTGRTWRKRMKRMSKLVVQQPIREPDGLQAASALCAAWWAMNQDRSSVKLNTSRDLRFASRLRGALADLRREIGNDAILLVPIQQAWREDMVKMLETHPDIEEVSSLNASSGKEEE
ncbi:MAG: hypothetical protein QGI21_04560 [Candidatus Poseidoniaceae archaeon]|nr:hypothetical protein [Candidatus Poseidoniaceae archaeon]